MEHRNTDCWHNLWNLQTNTRIRDARNIRERELSKNRNWDSEWCLQKNLCTFRANFLHHRAWLDAEKRKIFCSHVGKDTRLRDCWDSMLQTISITDLDTFSKSYCGGVLVFGMMKRLASKNQYLNATCTCWWRCAISFWHLQQSEESEVEKSEALWDHHLYEEHMGDLLLGAKDLGLCILTMLCLWLDPQTTCVHLGLCILSP